MLTKENLKQIELFKFLNDEELDRIIPLCSEEKYEKDDIIFRENEDANKFYIVEKGEISLVIELSKSKETIIRSLGNGDVFSWSALVKPYKWSVSALCKSQATVIAIPGKKLLEMFEKNHHIGYVCMRRLAEIIGERLRNTSLALLNWYE